MLFFSNNLINDDDLYWVINGLTHQLHFGKFSKSKRGLESLVISNNKLTRRAATHINVAIVGKKQYLTLEKNVFSSKKLGVVEIYDHFDFVERLEDAQVPERQLEPA